MAEAARKLETLGEADQWPYLHCMALEYCVLGRRMVRIIVKTLESSETIGKSAVFSRIIISRSFQGSSDVIGHVKARFKDARKP